jgi:tetratricopeptide (TPR) repeat protein
MVSQPWLAFVAVLTAMPGMAQLVTKSNAAPLTDVRQETVPSTAHSTRDLSPEVRADILMARKMYREAAELYATGAQNNAVLANKLGIAYHQMLQFDLARRNYERAIKLNPKYAEAINNLGTIYYAQKKYRRAVNQYQKALKLAPESASIYSNLGTAEFARKRYEEALLAYQKAVILDPDVFEHRGSTGVLLQERTVQERAKFHYFLAKTYAKSGNALEEGFKERQKFSEEPEFATLRELPEFQELMKMEPRVL